MRTLPTQADLPPAAQRQLAKLPEDLRDVVAACYPSDELEMQARRDEEERQRQQLREERKAMLEMADKAELGAFGPEGKQLALEILDGREGGRSDFNLGRLRTALRRLR